MRLKQHDDERGTAVEDWYSFCDNIHFYGPEDELYREELRNLPNRDEYKWAFSRK